jgi:hypothetical protein
MSYFEVTADDYGINDDVEFHIHNGHTTRHGIIIGGPYPGIMWPSSSVMAYSIAIGMGSYYHNVPASEILRKIG